MTIKWGQGIAYLHRPEPYGQPLSLFGLHLHCTANLRALEKEMTVSQPMRSVFVSDVCAVFVVLAHSNHHLVVIS